MRIVQLDPADRDAMRACHEVHVAASATDDPHEPPLSLRVFGVWLTSGWEGDPGEVWYVPGESPGEALAWYRLNLPDLENKDRAFLIPVVRPTARRNGIGRQLLRHGADRAAANGRTILGSVAVQDSAGAAFAMAARAKAGLVEARRLLDLHKVPATEFARLRERAATAATGYTIVSWTGPTPEEYLSLVAGALNAMNDAPSDEGWEDEIWDADRVRDRANMVVRLTDARGYSVAALHDASGEMAALTQVDVDPERPDWGYQGLTAVTRPHRGHRLGLLTKAIMMEWLTTAEPQVERVVTGNAESNRHMIAVNDALGYELYPPGWQSYEIPVTKALRAFPAEGMKDTSAIDALAELFRLPTWRINDSRIEFVKAAAEILSEVRDLAGPPAPLFLREHGWTYDAEANCYGPIDEALADYMDCDFCDRLFRPNAAGKYEGITRILGPLDPVDPDLGILVQEICDLCRAGLPADWSPAWPDHETEEQGPQE
jgi:GNAT superfamily N-acetyltransferase